MISNILNYPNNSNSFCGEIMLMLLLIIVGLILALIVLGIVIYIVSIYNRFQTLKNGAEATLGQIRVALKRDWT